MGMNRRGDHMVITLYFTLSWMMMGLLIFHRQRSKESRRDIIFLVLLTCLINTHTYLGLFETFNWIKTTTIPKLYIAFLLFRSVFIPLFISYLTLYLAYKSLRKQLVLVFLFCFIIIGIDIINVQSGLYTFKKWNYTFTVIYYLLYLFFVRGALQWFRGLEGENNNDVGRRQI
jgi:hypothetical protein